MKVKKFKRGDLRLGECKRVKIKGNGTRCMCRFEEGLGWGVIRFATMDQCTKAARLKEIHANIKRGRVKAAKTRKAGKGK